MLPAVCAFAGVRDAAAREKRQRLGTGGELGADGDGEVDGSHSDGEDSDEEQQQQVWHVAACNQL